MTLKLAELVREYGHKNIRVIMNAQPLLYAGFIPGIAFTSSDSPLVPNVEFEIDNERYDVTQNFKVKLVPASPENKLRLASRTFYVSDFESIAQRHGGIRVMLLTIDGYSTLFYKPEE